MKKPTDKQIQSEIAKLKAAKGYIPNRTAFGDDNQAAVDAQIAVLAERLSIDDCYDRGNEEGENDPSKWPHHARESAVQAAQWLEGDEPESPASSWDGFKKRK